MNKKRVLIVGHSAALGGGEIYIYNLSKILSELDYDVSCICFERGDLIESYVENNIAISIVPIEKLTESKIKELVEGYDLVIANTMVCIFFAVYSQKYCKTILILHECRKYLNDFFKFVPPAYDSLKNIDHIVAVSAFASISLNDLHLSAISVINNYVFDEKFKYKNIPCGNKIKFLTVSNWDWVKGYDIMLSAFQQLPENCFDKIEWHIVGRFWDREESIDFLKEVEKSNWIIYHGEIKHRDKILDLYNHSQIYIQAARQESSSLSVCDAAMMGIPIIVSDQVGAKYLAENGGGWIVEAGNVQQLTATLTKIIVENHLFDKKIQQVRKNYLKYATVDVYKKRLCTYLNEIFRLNDRQYADNFLNYELFPNFHMEKGSRIALYGVTMKGKINYFYLKESPDYIFAAWFDQAYEKYKDLGVEITSPEKIAYIDFDFILICNTVPKTICAIRNYLVRLGVDDKKIKQFIEIET